MKTEDFKLDSLIPYEFNNRNHDEQQVDRIANSIQQFGFNQPIVIDENNVILVGHGRLLAAQKLGLKTAPVLKKTGLTETQKKAYRILDNKLQNDSTWSFDNLELELGFLEDNGFELEPWGLDELRDLFGNPADAAANGEAAGPSLADFLTAYRLIIKESCALLKPNRFACFVVGDYRDKKGNYCNLPGETIAAFHAAGLQLYNEAILVTAVGSLPIRVGRQFQGGRKLGKTHQNVLVFVKGDGKKATTDCGPVEVHLEDEEAADV